MMEFLTEGIEKPYSLQIGKKEESAADDMVIMEKNDALILVSILFLNNESKTYTPLQKYDKEGCTLLRTD
jgi:hypothetical protein